MKRIIIATLLILIANQAFAQNESILQLDTIPSYLQRIEVDTLLMGRDIFDVLAQKDETQGNISITQSSIITKSFKQHLINNTSKKIIGYRIRIFFDNSQNAREQSERVLNQFQSTYSTIRAYRSHVSPYFKVTVGDFRTRGEASLLAETLKATYPSAFIVKESINYPNL